MAIDYGKKNILRNSVLSVVYKIVSLLLSLVSAPLMLGCLGETKYGVWASLLSIVSWIYYLDLGIGNGFRNKVAACLARKEYVEARKYIGVSYVLVALISAAAFFVALLLLLFFDVSSVFHIQDVGENVNLILLVAILLASVNFVAQLVNNLLYATQKASFVSLFSIISQAIMIGALFLYKYLNIKLLLAIVLADGLGNFIRNVVATLYVYVKFPEFRGSFHKIDFNYSHGIMTLGVQMFIMQMAALILNTTDNLVILKYFGPKDVTPYSFCYKYFSIITSFFSVIITPLISAYTAAYEQKKLNWILKALKSNIALLLLFSIGTVAASFVFEPFARVWLQKSLYFQPGLIGYNALYCCISMISTTFASFVYGISKVKLATIATVVQAVINIPVSIMLAINCGMGLNGVILGSVISMAISAIVDPLITVKEIRALRKTVSQS
jgi:O-antigen/teichoic acid export membrane protein